MKRVASAYGAVSEAAVLVKAAVILTDFLAKERKNVEDMKDKHERLQMRRQARAARMPQWQ